MAIEDSVPASAPEVSPFLDPGALTKPNSLAIVHLSRDNLLPVLLHDSKGEQHDGYVEGAVINTRFGSFPHSTLLGVPWGSQIRASVVDTGSRGGRKRKRVAVDDDNVIDSSPAPTAGQQKALSTAASGFVHLLPPTPELWTMGLPHRTQVVYTPDYSYILHRIRARPGTRLIEAGAGSGSFTHAAARAVYNGTRAVDDDECTRGKVFSFEYHEQRYHKMIAELKDHHLDDLVQLTHRDVYQNGFLVDDGVSPNADAVFLDLPAPWEALSHLSRRDSRADNKAASSLATPNGHRPWVSPLNPKKSVHICTFSPCIEQVTRTVSAMRRLGWVNIEMVEIANRKIQVFRVRLGLQVPAEKGGTAAPANVEEAVARLAQVEVRVREHAAKLHAASLAAMDLDADEEVRPPDDAVDGAREGRAAAYKPHVEGRLITRGEAEIKTHTSYLVFAVLPREWSAEDEAAAFARWPCGGEQRTIGNFDKVARRKEKQDLMEAARERKQKGKKQLEMNTEAAART